MSTLPGENVTIDLANSTIYANPTYPLTEEACLAAGGHCYKEDSRTYNQPVDPLYYRTCKHCGKVQRGTPPQGIGWEDA